MSLRPVRASSPAENASPEIRVYAFLRKTDAEPNRQEMPKLAALLGRVEKALLDALTRAFVEVNLPGAQAASDIDRGSSLPIARRRLLLGWRYR
jgi:hypothetical protein